MSLAKRHNILSRLAQNAKELLADGYYSNQYPTANLPSLRKMINSQFVVMGEIKPGSPSQGRMYHSTKVETKIDQICQVVDGISVLTEPNYFFGSLDTVNQVLEFNRPVLMKDFIIDIQQIKATPASVILLIKSLLDEEQINDLTEYAHSAGKEVILEVDNEQDFIKQLDGCQDILAINNRNLATMKVDVNKATELVENYQPEIPILGFSGYKTIEQIVEAAEHGVGGVLIGTVLSKSKDPAEFNARIRTAMGVMQ